MSDLKAKEYVPFEQIKHVSEEGQEFWYARELSLILEYTEWRNFSKVVDRAKLACKNSGYELIDHFVDVNKTINMPKTATKEILDIKLTRYACYLIVQNGDPRKEVIAIGQTYFAIQTRRQDAANEVHFIVGKEVRNTIKRVGGTLPEDLPVPEKSINEIEREQLKKLKKNPKNLMLDE